MALPQLPVSSIGLELTDKNNSCVWLGGYQPLSLSASDLHDFVERRNNYIVHVLLPRLDEIQVKGLSDKGYHLSNLNLAMRKNNPEFNEPLEKIKTSLYEHSLFHQTLYKYKLNYNKVEASFVTPTLDLYLHYVQYNRKNNPDSYTPDLEGWKNWITDNRVICTRFFFILLMPSSPLKHSRGMLTLWEVQEVEKVSL